jgi:hypothetical protein
VGINAPHVKKIMSSVNTNKGVVLKPEYVKNVSGGDINQKKIVKTLKKVSKEALKSAVAGSTGAVVTGLATPVMGPYAPMAGMASSALVGYYVNPKIDGLGLNGSLNGYPTNPNNILSNIQRGGSFRSLNGDGIAHSCCHHCGQVMKAGSFK